MKTCKGWETILIEMNNGFESEISLFLRLQGGKLRERESFDLTTSNNLAMMDDISR